MNYEIIGESIKSATSLKLGEIFGNVTRYKENITNQTFPNFHIIQTNLSVTPRQTYTESAFNHDLRRIQLDYLMNIQYRVAENTETITNLRQQLDEVGLKLLAEFNTLNLGLPVYATNCNYEIVDGVLQFFFNITLFATVDQQEDVLMEQLEINEYVLMQQLDLN